MFTTAFVVVAVAVYVGCKRKALKGASVAAGVVLGLVLMGTPLGGPLAEAAQSAATAIGEGLRGVVSGAAQ